MSYVLLIAHFVGDFLCQSNWMAVNKSKRWDALALHALAYGGVLAVAVLMVSEDSAQVLWFLSANIAAHFAQDAITSLITARLWFIEMTARKIPGGYWTHIARPNDMRHWFFVAIGADQLLHTCVLVLTADWWLQ